MGLGLAVLAVYLPALFGRDYFADDAAILQITPHLSLWKLWTSGYWQAAQGDTMPVHYYRPFLTTTFWLTGLALPWARLLNIAIHFIGAALLKSNLERRMDKRAAFAAALFWAVSPMHVEAVAQLSGRSELLSGACLWAAWLCLDTGRRAAGLGLFTLALLSKETAFFFPFFYALVGDRKQVLPLLACAGGVLGVRGVVLPRLIEGGASYFDSRVEALRTIPSFWLRHYVVPALTGLGGCTDYSRPLIPDGRSLIPALALGGALIAARKRWEAAFLVFMVPVSHLLMPIDTIGAQRWLYLPLAGLAAALARFPRALVALSVWLGATACVKAAAARSAESWYAEAAACNPGSARAWSSWAGAALQRGDKAEGRRRLEKALELQPNLPTPHYNLARLAYEEGRWEDAARHVERSLELLPDADAHILAALIAQKRGDEAASARHLALARRLVPEHPLLQK